MHRVVRNSAGHFSIWPIDASIPAGWRSVGIEGSREHCLDAIEQCWDDPGPPVLEDAPEPLLTRWLTLAAQAAPDAVALVDGQAQLTYRELEQRVDGLAAALRARVGEGAHRVGILAERSLATVALILAAVRAGLSYVPLDPSYPDARLELFFQTARPAILVIDESTATRPLAASPAAVTLRALAPPAAPPKTGPDARSAELYVLFTSGSTGRPKGVSFPVKALESLVGHLRATLPQGRRTLQLSPLSFDVSAEEIFATFATGGTLVICPDAARADPAEVLALLEARQVQLAFPAYALLQLLASAAVGKHLRLALERVYVAGEQLKVTDAIRALLASSGAELVNHYGPTETHVVTEHRLGADAARWPGLPPIGRAVPGATATVVDEQLRPVAPGERGELLIGGASVADGYVGAPRRTAERFVPDPGAAIPGARAYRSGDLCSLDAAGALTFHGRADSQVKIRGYRVELEEVESALLALEGVRQAAAVAAPGALGELSLVAFLCFGGAPRDAASLRRALREQLPEHLVPARFVALERLPMTPSGKVDRRALAEGLTVPGAAPYSRVMRELAAHEALLSRDGATTAYVEVDALELDGQLSSEQLVEAVRVVSGAFELWGRRLEAGQIHPGPPAAPVVLLEPGQGPLDETAVAQRARALRSLVVPREGRNVAFLVHQAQAAQWQLLAAYHHLVVDSRTADLFAAELVRALAQPGTAVAPRPLPRERAARPLAPPALQAGPLVRDVALTSAARTVELVLEAAAWEQLRKAAARLGFTPNAGWLAVFGLALSEWSGQERVRVGVPFEHRAPEEVDEVGLFASTYPLELSCGVPFPALVEQAGERLYDALEGDGVDLSAASRRLLAAQAERGPLFEALCAFNARPRQQSGAFGAQSRFVPPDDAKVPLLLAVETTASRAFLTVDEGLAPALPRLEQALARALRQLGATLLQLAPRWAGLPRAKAAAPPPPRAGHRDEAALSMEGLISLVREGFSLSPEEPVRPEDDLFDLGANSLTVALFADLLSRRFQVEVSPRDVFRHPTLIQLLALLKERVSEGEAGPRAPAGGGSAGASFPLLFAQGVFLFPPIPEAENVLVREHRLQGAELAALRRAFSEAQRRHPASRLRFSPAGDRQWVADALAELEVAPPDPAWPAGVRAAVSRQEPGLACRARQEGGELIFLTAAHHAVMDDFGLGVFVRDLAHYAEQGRFPEPAPVDFERVVRARLAARPSPLIQRNVQGATVQPSPDRTYGAATRFPRARMLALAERFGVGLPALMSGAMGLAISRAAGLPLLSVGWTSHGRPSVRLRATSGALLSIFPLLIDARLPLEEHLRSIELQTREHQVEDGYDPAILGDPAYTNAVVNYMDGAQWLASMSSAPESPQVNDEGEISPAYRPLQTFIRGYPDFIVGRADVRARETSAVRVIRELVSILEGT